MNIGTVRIEEAITKDSRAGFHEFYGESGSFEVFWDDADTGPYSDEPRNFNIHGDPVTPGWYWWPCFPGCLPEGDPVGPFTSSIAAYYDAMDY
jgi:hypothetical protein